MHDLDLAVCQQLQHEFEASVVRALQTNPYPLERRHNMVSIPRISFTCQITIWSLTLQHLDRPVVGQSAE